MPDIRPLYKRKRVWGGAIALLAVGAAFGSSDPSAASPCAARKYDSAL
ncbi:hypothetical protein [Streptomyces sp. NPDC002758]